MSYVKALLAMLGAAEGRARRLALFRHFHAEREPLFLLCWRPGGEDGRAAAVTYALGRGPARTVVAGDPRNWELQAHMLHEFALAFNPWFDRFAALRVPCRRTKQGEERLVVHAAPQVVVANTATKKFLGQLAQFVKVLPPSLRTPELDRLALHLAFLHELSGSKGQSLLVVMTQALDFHYAIPLMAPERQSLSVADVTVCHDRSHYIEALVNAEETQFGPLPATGWEKEVFEVVRQFNAARGKATDRASVTPFLDPIESEYRSLSAPALEILRESYYREASYTAAPSVQGRRLEDRRRYTLHVDWAAGGRQRGLAPTPWHAFRWMRRMEEDAAVFDAESACDDPALMAEHLVAGGAFRGRVISSDPHHTEPGRARRVVRPLVTLRLDEDCTPPPPGQEFWLSTHPHGKPWVVAEVRPLPAGGRFVMLRLTTEGRKLSIPAAGECACFVSFSADRGPWMQLPKSRPRAFGGV